MHNKDRCNNLQSKTTNTTSGGIKLGAGCFIRAYGSAACLVQRSSLTQIYIPKSTIRLSTRTANSGVRSDEGRKRHSSRQWYVSNSEGSGRRFDKSRRAKGMFLLVKVVMLDVLEGELMDRELNRKDITGMIHRQRQTCKHIENSSPFQQQ